MFVGYHSKKKLRSFLGSQSISILNFFEIGAAVQPCTHDRQTGVTFIFIMWLKIVTFSPNFQLYISCKYFLIHLMKSCPFVTTNKHIYFFNLNIYILFYSFRYDFLFYSLAIFVFMGYVYIKKILIENLLWALTQPRDKSTRNY